MDFNLNDTAIKRPYTQAASIEIPTSSKGEAPAAQKADADTVMIGGDLPPAPPKKWTIMHYCAADNDLKQFLVKDVNEMEAVGSTQNMNIVVQIDQGGSDCKRLYIEKDADLKKINSPVLAELGRTNMADSQVMADFIKFSMEKFPAEHYALIISDHGGGWLGAVYDESHGKMMSMPDIRKGIEMGISGKRDKLDVLGFDACMMANTEVAFEMKDCASYMAGSENNEGFHGWPYTQLLTRSALNKLERVMRGKLNISPESFARKIIETASTDHENLPTLSAMDLSKMNQVAEATNEFSQNLIDTATENHTFREIALSTETFGNFHFRDHYHFAQQVAESPKIEDVKLKESAKGLMKALKSAVIAEEHDPKFPNAHGLTAEIPMTTWYDTLGVRFGYNELMFSRLTKWDEAMNKISKIP